MRSHPFLIYKRRPPVPRSPRKSTIFKARGLSTSTTMTPNITAEVMASRPLYDPHPSTYVAKHALKHPTLTGVKYNLKRVRLSDFVIVAHEMLIRTSFLTRKEVDIFETAYVRGAKVRDARLHQGRPALAPDGTVMGMRREDGAPIEVYCGNGSHGYEMGPWTVENVHACPGYAAWLRGLRQSVQAVRNANPGIGERMIGGPWPSERALVKANAFINVPQKDQERTERGMAIIAQIKGMVEQVEDMTGDDQGQARARLLGEMQMGFAGAVVGLGNLLEYVGIPAQVQGIHVPARDMGVVQRGRARIHGIVVRIGDLINLDHECETDEAKEKLRGTLLAWFGERFPDLEHVADNAWKFE